MRYFLLSLLLAVAQAQPVLTSVFRQNGHLGIAAYWTNPTNEIWIAEWSTNLVTWYRTSNEHVYLANGLRFTESSLDWTPQLFFRLRKLP